VFSDTPRADRETYVPVQSVHVDPKKLRKLSATKIRQYAACLEAGDEFPPIVVVDCGDFYTIRDGRHRYQAQVANGYRFIAVIIV
jgi:hypothetical protein